MYGCKTKRELQQRKTHRLLLKIGRVHRRASQPTRVLCAFLVSFVNGTMTDPGSTTITHVASPLGVSSASELIHLSVPDSL